MDFFAHQDKARNRTFWFIILFFLGLILLSALVTLTANLILRWTVDSQLPNFTWYSFGRILIPTTLITGIISLYKFSTLKAGGKTVAEALQGRLVDKKTANAAERRLLNVVEEMAIAASLPVPPVYILDDETGINAFAAGYTMNDAVIGITQGAIELLNRDELQAVIGHEFSHILNGDMRINLRFTALIYGFFFLMEIGSQILSLFSRLRVAPASNRSKKDGGGIIVAILLLALLCYVAGWLSALWARLMQAAINRQREYLADASSVQFTRHPLSLASALKKIGGNAYGSTLQRKGTQSFSHLFFSQADNNLFSTHPPLEKRIKLLDRAWNGKFITPTLLEEDDIEETSSLSKQDQAITAIIATASLQPLTYTMPVSILNTTPVNAEQAMVKLEAICQEPMDACYFIFALLLDDQPDIRKKQLSILKNIALIKDYYQLLLSIPKPAILTFIEKAVPTLKLLSDEQYKGFQQILMHFIHADNKVSMDEWLIYQLISHQVSHQFNPKKLKQKNKFTDLIQLQEEASILLSAIAFLTPSPEGQKKAFNMGANVMGLYNIKCLDFSPEAAELTTSLQKFQISSDTVRKKFLQGALRAIEQDAVINNEEAVFFRILSLCLDCPIAL